jgi:hypothetical protein
MGIWRGRDEVERKLRTQRPEPRRELVDEIASRMVGGRRRSHRRVRLGFAVALSVGMLVALGSVGGLGYAANGVTHAVSSAVHAVVPSEAAAPSSAVSSAMAQYKVSMCFHGHTLSVDSHAVNALRSAGAKLGACGGGAFKPATKLTTMCFKGRNVTVALSERAKLKKLHFKAGFCKT